MIEYQLPLLPGNNGQMFANGLRARLHKSHRVDDAEIPGDVFCVYWAHSKLDALLAFNRLTDGSATPLTCGILFVNPHTGQVHLL
jgi:hypothetical protein